MIEEVSNDTNKDAPEEEIVCEAMESVGISRYGLNVILIVTIFGLKSRNHYKSKKFGSMASMFRFIF